jgi:hypothetical protein
VNTKDDRDRSIDDMLRQSFRARGGAGAADSSCPDAETLAAWADGSLSTSTLATVEAHLSDCSRCQRVVAVLAKLPASGPVSEPRWQWGLALRWLVPLAATATAIAIWVAVPRREAPPAVGSQQSAVGSQQSAAKEPPAAPPETPARARADESALKSERADAAPEQREALRKDASPRAPSGNLDSVAEPVSAAQPAGAPAAAALKADAVSAAPRAEAFAPARQANVIAQEVVSTTPSIRWRIGPRGLLQYSASGGAAWERLSTDVVADLVAGASPSSSVCWVVGRSGTVLLTVDGRRFSRVPFPATVDLAAVRATDARTAVVTTADGRTFSTADGGSTWAQ